MDLKIKSKYINKILDEVVLDISPSSDEEREEKILSKKITEELYNILHKEDLMDIVVDIVQVGSTARGTNLKNDYDIDIFVRFKKI